VRRARSDCLISDEEAPPLQVFVPAEQGPVLPVDRSWALSKNQVNDDWACLATGREVIITHPCIFSIK
jgi:hypothetical protein